MKIMLMLMTPHLFPCGAHDTADSPVKKAKSARHCFSCSKRKFYMFAQLQTFQTWQGVIIGRLGSPRCWRKRKKRGIPIMEQIIVTSWKLIIIIISLLSRSVLQNLSPLSLWSLVSVSDRGNKDNRVEERTWQKKISSMLSNSLKTCDRKQIYLDDLMNLGMSTSAYSRLHVRPSHPPGTLCLE